VTEGLAAARPITRIEPAGGAIPDRSASSLYSVAWSGQVTGCGTFRAVAAWSLALRVELERVGLRRS